MATMNISLPDPMRDWVSTQIESGQYANNSEYVRDLIHRDQQRVQKIAAFQEAINAGLASGDPKDFDMKAFQKQMLEKS